MLSAEGKNLAGMHCREALIPCGEENCDVATIHYNVVFSLSLFMSLFCLTVLQVLMDQFSMSLRQLSELRSQEIPVA